MKEHFNIVLGFTVSVVMVFSALYLLFNQFIWKIGLFGKMMKFPDLTGEYECVGLSNNIELQQQFEWEGTVVIKQNWDKILISIKSNSSTSNSLSLTGGIRYFPGVGYKMSYHYENTPNVTARELKKHEGFCILTFSEDRLSAEGCYFNNTKDRASYGEMKLKRRLNDGNPRLLQKAG